MAANPDIELSTEGLESQGRFSRGLAVMRPPGTAKEAAAAVAAGALAQTARMTGDKELAKMAAQAADHAGDVGHAEPLNQEESDRYDVPVGAGGPPSLTAPFSSLPEEGEDETEEPESEVEVEEEEEPELPDHIAEALEDEEEDEDDDEEGEEWRDYEDERPLVAETPPAPSGSSVEAIAEEFGYQLFEVETDPRVKALVETTLRERRRAEEAAAGKRKAQRKSWVTDATTHFEFVDKQSARQIAAGATSQRDFYRKVKAENDRVRKLVARHTGTLVARAEAEREADAQEQRRQRQEQWGDPPSGTGSGGGDFAGAPDMSVTRRNKGLAGVIAERRKRGQIRI